MPVLSTLTNVAGRTARGARSVARSAAGAGRFVSRRWNRARDRGGAGEAGMIRLLDLHAASCAGDTLVAIGLAGTIFFSVPVGEARGRVALYLLLTMAPFALLAPVVGPLLDRFRHGRRYALALTMLGRAFLAWIISDHVGGFLLYPAAFGILVLSRAYGVARSAAVPRVLPPQLGLVEAGARASVFGTVAGALVAPVGVALFWLGPEWTLRFGTVIFILGMIAALRLPPRADSDPPEIIPRAFQLRHKGAKILSGRLVTTVLTGSATLRAMYGFLTLFLAFRIREKDFNGRLAGFDLPEAAALAVVAASLGVGSFVATLVCTRLKIRRPAQLQAAGLIVVAICAVVATIWYGIALAAVLCLFTAIASGLAKLAVDAVIQERLPERTRASAFAHSETLLMLAWVLGGAIGLVPFSGQIGVGIAAAFAALIAARMAGASWRLRNERLRGVIVHDDEPAARTRPAPDSPTRPLPSSEQTQRVPATTSRRRGPRSEPTQPAPSAEETRRMTGEEPTAPLAPPGYHLYRPTRRDE